MPCQIHSKPWLIYSHWPPLSHPLYLWGWWALHLVESWFEVFPTLTPTHSLTTTVPLRIVSPTSCGMMILRRCPNSWRISCCNIGDSANPPTRKMYLMSKKNNINYGLNTMTHENRAMRNMQPNVACVINMIQADFLCGNFLNNNIHGKIATTLCHYIWFKSIRHF